jgi:hypothetical protein
MPTICELKAQLKAKGIKGITGLNKGGLIKLLEGGVSIPSKPKASKTAPSKPKASKEPYPSLPAKKKTTKATSANLNALYKAGKKKVLAIKYKEPEKPITIKVKSVKPKEEPIKEKPKEPMSNKDLTKMIKVELTKVSKSKPMNELADMFREMEEDKRQAEYVELINIVYNLKGMKQLASSGEFGNHIGFAIEERLKIVNDKDNKNNKYRKEYADEIKKIINADPKLKARIQRAKKAGKR